MSQQTQSTAGTDAGLTDTVTVGDSLLLDYDSIHAEADRIIHRGTVIDGAPPELVAIEHDDGRIVHLDQRGLVFTSTATKRILGTDTRAFTLESVSVADVVSGDGRE